MIGNPSTPRFHKLFWGSSYDRGLDVLLYMWSEIKKEIPDVELHICYGWQTFDAITRGNPERQEWKKGVELLIQQEGIYHYGRINKDKLKELRQGCGIWSYSTYFPEINCITALDCQKDGLVPVTMNYAALSEVVKSGILVKGDIRKPDVQKQYVKQLIELMRNKDRWEEISKKAKKSMKGYYWSDISSKWIDVFKEPIKMPKVSIITPTIRTGFWNIMADNLSKQTYKNFEWIIVDDYKQSRDETAKKYITKYNLDIKYIRGDKSLGKYDRRLGLVRANNQAWKLSTGELLIWLQDFILIDETAVERLVDLYRHNPNTIFAPVDIYYHTKIKPNKNNLEDWFDGQTNIVGNKDWTNIRVKYQGIRPTENNFDFETNFGAIPKSIVEELNGFWEFFDDFLGYDNSEFSLRALKMGYKLLIDDSIIAKCLNLWDHIKGEDENIKGRERLLATPVYLYLVDGLKKGRIPIIRDSKLDDSIHLKFEVPKDIKDEDCANWINNNAENIARRWIKDAIY